MHKAGAAAAPGAKRQRGPAWLPSVADVTPLAEGVCEGELATVLEFVQVWGRGEVLQGALPGRNDSLAL